MEENVKCMDCSKNIKFANKRGIEFIPVLNKEEKTSELNNLIKNHNYKNIHSCICVNCLHEYIPLMKAKTNEEKIKHNNYMVSLKDLLLDVSDQDNINEIMNLVLNDDEIIELQINYKNLKEERIKMEKKINENKKELKELRDKEENICVKINKNLREKEENKKITDKLLLKLKYLKNEYDKLINQDKDDFE